MQNMWKKGSSVSEDPTTVADQGSHEECGDDRARDSWTNKTEYMLSMIGYAIGLGNIWRFPYLVYKNGGGAFIIPYVVTLFLCGIPMFFLESAIGQFCSQGSINMWRAVPLLQGTGISVVFVNTMMSIYYNVIIAYSLYYMFASFQSPLPWSSCFSWADSNCSGKPLVYCNVSGVLVGNWTQGNSTSCPSSNQVTVPVQSPSEQYWDRVALQRSGGLDETGPVVWHLALCLLLSTVLSAAALVKGIKSTGKIVYFTAILPYVVILILLIKGLTLEGAREGIEFYIGSQSNFSKLADAQVWQDAVTQTCYSLSIAYGGLVTLSSYSDFHNNMFLDSVLISVANHVTSFFAGFAIFCVLGHMAHIYDKPVGEVVREGFGLAFIAYPDVLAKLPISPLWSFLFFFMLFIIGIDSQFTLLEVIITSMVDAFPGIQSRRAFLSFGTCLVVFLLGLPCVTRAGIYWVTLIDQFSATWVLLVLALIEIIGFCYIYGVNRVVKDIEMMIGKKSFYFWFWWRACWYFISPFVILVVLVWSLMSFVPPTYGNVQFPAWGLDLGWCIAIVILLWIPVVAVYKLACAEGNPWKRVKTVCSPSEEWHPLLDIHRDELKNNAATIEKACQQTISE